METSKSSLKVEGFIIRKDGSKEHFVVDLVPENKEKRVPSKEENKINGNNSLDHD